MRWGGKSMQAGIDSRDDAPRDRFDEAGGEVEPTDNNRVSSAP